MPDASELMKTIKRAAVDAVNAAKPVEICFGRVISASPLQILVDQKLTLGRSQLVLCRNVTEHEICITGDNVKDYHYTGVFPGDVMKEPLGSPHVHAIGKIKITVHNGLAVGDEVLLLRQQGGQKYIVADRIA